MKEIGKIKFIKMLRYSLLQSIAWLAYKIQSYILRIIARKTPFYHAKSRSKIAGLSCFFWTFCNTFFELSPGHFTICRNPPFLCLFGLV